MDDFIKELRSERREGSIISNKTVDSLSADDRIAWREIRKELEDMGITIAAFDANRDFIFEWFSNVVKSGALDEKPQDSHVHIELDDSFNAEMNSSKKDRRSKQPDESQAKIRQNVSDPKGLERIIQKLKARDFHRTSENRLEERDAQSDAPIAKMLALGQEQAFFDAIAQQDNYNAVKSPNDKASIDDLSEETLKDALVQICQKIFPGDRLQQGVYMGPPKGIDLSNEDRLVRNILKKLPSQHCLDDYILDKIGGIEFSLKDKLTTIALERDWQQALEIIDPDVNVQLLMSDLETYSLLQMAAMIGSTTMTRFLIQKGADVNYCSDNWGTALLIVLEGGENEVAQVLVDHGAMVSSRATPRCWCPYSTLVEAAVYWRNVDGLKILLKKDATASTLSTLKFALDCFYHDTRWNSSKRGTNVKREMLTILAKTDPRHVDYFKDDGTNVEDKVQRMLEDLSGCTFRY